MWFITGSQELYGKEVLKKVEENSKKLVRCTQRCNFNSCKDCLETSVEGCRSDKESN